ncbi:hypothetical protein Tco_0378757 [Tanacetum coccineum]
MYQNEGSNSGFTSHVTGLFQAKFDDKCLDCLFLPNLFRTYGRTWLTRLFVQRLLRCHVAAFLQKLYVGWSVTKDREFARRICVLLREMEVAYDERMDFIRELEVVSGVNATVKTAEFFNKTLWKDDKRLQKLHNMEMDANEKAFQKDRFIERL